LHVLGLNGNLILVEVFLSPLSLCSVWVSLSRCSDPICIIEQTWRCRVHEPHAYYYAEGVAAAY